MKFIKGTVVSIKTANAVVVEVIRTAAHPLYHKRVTRKNRFLVHDNKGAKVGDVVYISPTRPKSAKKRFEVKEIIK